MQNEKEKNLARAIFIFTMEVKVVKNSRNICTVNILQDESILHVPVNFNMQQPKFVPKIFLNKISLL